MLDARQLIRDKCHTHGFFSPPLLINRRCGGVSDRCKQNRDFHGDIFLLVGWGRDV